jgi:hypothetical protein
MDKDACIRNERMSASSEKVGMVDLITGKHAQLQGYRICFVHLATALLRTNEHYCKPQYA